MECRTRQQMLFNVRLNDIVLGIDLLLFDLMSILFERKTSKLLQFKSLFERDRCRRWQIGKGGSMENIMKNGVMESTRVQWTSNEEWYGLISKRVVNTSIALNIITKIITTTTTTTSTTTTATTATTTTSSRAYYHYYNYQYRKLMVVRHYIAWEPGTEDRRGVTTNFDVKQWPDVDC